MFYPKGEPLQLKHGLLMAREDNKLLLFETSGWRSCDEGRRS